MPVYSKGWVIIQIFLRLHLFACPLDVDHDPQTYNIYCHLLHICQGRGKKWLHGSFELNTATLQRGQLALFWLIGFQCERSSLSSRHKMSTPDISATHFLEKPDSFKNCSLNSSTYYVNKQVSSVFGMLCSTNLSPLSRFSQAKNAFHLMELFKDTSSFTYFQSSSFI